MYGSRSLHRTAGRFSFHCFLVVRQSKGRCRTQQQNLTSQTFLAIVASIGTSPLYLSVQAEVVDKNRTGNDSLRIVQRQIIVLLLDLFYPFFFFLNDQFPEQT